ncbi:hypothetical protein OIU78_016383 [Salix suchowensis]|nr:hypothetical protein OIU78_016383 [Salix suchowensis]
MVQWESARVEAEARLSMQSLLLKSKSTAKSHPDIFLQLWKSEVGEAFRIIEEKDGKTSEKKQEEDTCKPNEDVMTVSDSIGSNEFADSTDTALKLLLDFPGGNDMEFIGEESEFFQLP